MQFIIWCEIKRCLDPCYCDSAKNNLGWQRTTQHEALKNWYDNYVQGKGIYVKEYNMRSLYAVGLWHQHDAHKFYSQDYEKTKDNQAIWVCSKSWNISCISNLPRNAHNSQSSNVLPQIYLDYNKIISKAPETLNSSTIVNKVACSETMNQRALDQC